MMIKPSDTIIILDVDGTLYPLGNVARRNYDRGVRFLSAARCLTADEARTLLDEEGILPYASPEAKSITKYFSRIGLNMAEWNEIRRHDFSTDAIDPEASASPESISSLARNTPLYIVSTNTKQAVEMILAHLSIDRKLFSGMICADTNEGNDGTFDKFKIFGNLLQKCGNRAKTLISIGDRYSSDIEPACRLGGIGILLHKPTALAQIAIDLSNGRLRSDSTDYAVYLPRTAKPDPGLRFRN